jgi:hypothetical protein
MRGLALRTLSDAADLDFDAPRYGVPLRQRTRIRPHNLDYGKARWENIKVATATSSNTAVWPGEAATPEVIAQEKKRNRLMELAKHFAKEGTSLFAGRKSTISQDTANAAIALLQSMTDASKLPLISPDGEEGLMMLWEDPDAPLLVTLQGWQLHVVINATTPQAEYHDALPYDGERVPQVLLSAISAR